MKLQIKRVSGSRRAFRRYLLLGLGVFLLGIAGCEQKPVEPKVVSQPPPSRAETAASSEGHEHKAGSHGGLIVSLGRDSYHVEAVFDNQGMVRLYTLGQDETRVIDILAKELDGFVKLESETEAQGLKFSPEPQSGDAEGRCSLFVAKLPESMIGQMVEVTIPNIAIDGERFRLAFTKATLNHGEGTHGGTAMPKKVDDDEEQRLYLEPGGHYTAADIEANGKMTPYQKYRGIASTHDMNPKPGDQICPITETKANPKFVWVIGGKGYQFCCPPCIDEFLQKAKLGGDPLPDPASFVQGGLKP